MSRPAHYTVEEGGCGCCGGRRGRPRLANDRRRQHEENTDVLDEHAEQADRCRCQRDQRARMFRLGSAISPERFTSVQHPSARPTSPPSYRRAKTGPDLPRAASETPQHVPDAPDCAKWLQSPWPNRNTEMPRPTMSRDLERREHRRDAAAHGDFGAIGHRHQHDRGDVAHHFERTEVQLRRPPAREAGSHARRAVRRSATLDEYGRSLRPAARRCAAAAADEEAHPAGTGTPRAVRIARA